VEMDVVASAGSVRRAANATTARVSSDNGTLGIGLEWEGC
jgi:hypothetical protein